MPPYLSGALSTIGTSAGGLVSLIGRLSGLLPVLNLINGRFGTLTRTMASFAIVVGAVAGAVTRAIGELRNMGNAITDLRASTGMSARSSGRLINSYNAQGLNAGQTASAFGGMNVYESQARARAFGVSSFNDIPGLARNYQNTSPLLRNQLLGSADSPELRRILMQSPRDLQGNANFQNRVQGGLGVDPSTIAKVSQQLSLVTTRFRILSETALVRLGAEVLPRLLNILTVVSNKLGDRSQQIGESISSGVDKGFQALVNVGTLISRFPEMFFALADSVLNFASTAISAIPVVWDTFLGGVSLTQNALQTLWESSSNGFQHLLGIAGMLEPSFLSLVDVVQYTAQHIGPLFAQLGGAITGFVAEVFNNPIVQRLLQALPAARRVAPTVNAIQGGIQGALSAAGASPDVAAAGGLLGPGALIAGGLGLARRFAGRSILGGAAAAAGVGATAAGGIGLGGLLGVGAVATAGALGLSSAYYYRLQQAGVLQGGKGFLENLGHGVGVVSDYFTGNQGKTQRDYTNYLTQVRHGTVAAPRGGIPTLEQFMGGRNHGTWATSLQNGTAMRDIGQSIRNVPNSSWANALDQRVGGASGLQASAVAAINGLRGDLNRARDAYHGDEIRDTLKKSLTQQEKQTQLLEKTDAQRNAAAQDLDRVAGYALQRFGREQGAALRRAGN